MSQNSEPCASKASTLQCTGATVLPVLSKPYISRGTIISIATPTRPSMSHSAKLSLGKHHLPVKSIPLSTFSHVAPKSTVPAFASTSGDPGGGGGSGGGFNVKPTLLAAPVQAKPKVRYTTEF